MTARYVAAIDQGTSSTRCIIYDRGGVMVSVAQRKHTQHFPQPGWVEHDALEIWKLVQRLIPEALRNGGIEADQLVGLGITNQRETTVIWDPTTGIPLHRAIVWQDTRTTDKVEELRAQGVAADAEHRTGAPLSNYFSAPRLSWMLDACAGSRAAAEQGEGAVRDHGHLAGVEPDRWCRRRVARHRPHQRQPHHADEHRDRAMGSDAARGVRHPRRDPAGDPAVDEPRGDDRHAGRGHPDHRDDR
ncbi:hypothetical protein GCM10009619_04610 [Williamsia maris]